MVPTGLCGVAEALKRMPDSDFSTRALLKWRHKGRSATSVLPLSTQIDCALARRTASATLVAAEPPLAFGSLEQCVADSDVQLCGTSS